MRSWEMMIPEQDRMIFEKGGFGGKQVFGTKPAILVVDVVESFTGKEPKDVLDAIEEYNTSCGNNAWKAIPYIKQIIELGRSLDIEVIYTKGNAIYKKLCGDSVKLGSPDEIFKTHSTPIVEAVSPLEHEFVLEKTKASAFFGTPLVTYLNKKNIDTLVVVGTSTSGCVRATVIDAFSYGYTTFVIEEGCFDRSVFFQNATLYDLNAKYATVFSYEEAKLCMEKSVQDNNLLTCK